MALPGINAMQNERRWKILCGDVAHFVGVFDVAGDGRSVVLADRCEGVLAFVCNSNAVALARLWVSAFGYAV